MSGWLLLSDPSEVIPIDDLREHTPGFSCWCRPADDEGIISHNALDRREEYESGARRPN